MTTSEEYLEQLAAEWKQTAEEYRADLQVERDRSRAQAAVIVERQLAAANALLDFIREEIRVCEAEAEQRDPEDEVYIQADGYRHIRAVLEAMKEAEIENVGGRNRMLRRFAELRAALRESKK